MISVVPSALTAATGAAILGADARLISQEYRRVLSTPGSTALAAPLRLGFRELLYFQVVNSLTAEGLQLSPDQKREVFRVLAEKPGRHVAPAAPLRAEPLGLRAGSSSRSGVPEADLLGRVFGESTANPLRI